MSGREFRSNWHACSSISWQNSPAALVYETYSITVDKTGKNLKINAHETLLKLWYNDTAMTFKQLKFVCWRGLCICLFVCLFVCLFWSWSLKGFVSSFVRFIGYVNFLDQYKRVAGYPACKLNFSVMPNSWVHLILRLSKHSYEMPRTRGNISFVKSTDKSR